MKDFKKYLEEKAPPGKKAEDWIKKNKTEFKKKYGNDWEEILYSTAWKIFGENIQEVQLYTEEELEERETGTQIRIALGKFFGKRHYRKALETLIGVVNRKKKENAYRHDIYYYAARIAASFPNVDARELGDMYKKAVNEQSTAATTQTGGVAMPDAPKFKKSKFMGHPCIEVDSNTYDACVKGKVPFKRWTKYVEDEELRQQMKDMFYKNKRMLVMDNQTGAMSFVK